MSTKFLILYTLLIPFSGYSQKQERQILAYNVTLGAISSGIGAVINKPKNADWKKYFIKGAWQGSLGGLMNYSGKKTLYLINKKNEPGYAWPAKILHAAGTSIIENAALTEPFLQNWNIDIGVIRLDFSINGNRSFKARFLPASIYSILKGSEKGKMDWGTTFKTGTISYYSKDYISSNNNFPAIGLSFGRGIIFTDIDSRFTNKVIAHELMHTFQYRDFMIINTFLKPLEKKVKSDILQGLFSKYVYFDIPYFHPIYSLEGKPVFGKQYQNFFEFEAERFATNRYVEK